MSELTQKRVRELFTYNKEEGKLYWKVKKSCKIKIGDLVGTPLSHGYKAVGINYKLYLLHRLIFFFHYGYIPKIVDHIDGNHLNNRIENLRAVTGSQNQMNRRKRKSASSKYKGVVWNKRSKKWLTTIVKDGKIYRLGSFITESTAARAYNRKALELYGNFVVLNDLPEIKPIGGKISGSTKNFIENLRNKMQYE